MRLKSLSNKELQEEILWSKVYAWTRGLEARYHGQPDEERRKEHTELHTIYRAYWDEAHRRGMVEKVSSEMEVLNTPNK